MKKAIQYSGGILVRSGKFLLGRRSVNRSTYGNKWDIFGGHIESGEGPEDTLQREFSEELGILPLDFELFKTVEFPVPDEPEITRFYMYFVTAWTGGEPVNCSDEHSEIRWFSRHELNGLELASSKYLDVIDQWEARPDKGN